MMNVSGIQKNSGKMGELLEEIRTLDEDAE